MVNTGRFIGVVLGFLLGMMGHELAHGYASDRLGDKTPRFNGRLSFNIKSHIDPVGTLVMPALVLLLALTGQWLSFGFLYGYTKPIPTNASRLRSPKRDQILIALAGPAANLALAAAGGLALRALPSSSTTLLYVLIPFTTVQVFLVVVNLLPIPSLDGAKILGALLSPQARWKIEELGQYFLLFLIVIVIFEPLRGAVQSMANPVCRLVTGAPVCLM